MSIVVLSKPSVAVDAADRRTDTSSGFVVAADAVLTAFQSIDTAAQLEIEFANGARLLTDEIVACDRFQDWDLFRNGLPVWRAFISITD